MKIKGVKVFNKGETVYCLLGSNSNPNLRFPVKCIIREVEQTDFLPNYVIQIQTFYDNLTYLKEHFFTANFTYGRKTTPKKKVSKSMSINKLSKYENITSLNQIYEILSGKTEFNLKYSKYTANQKKTVKDYAERHYMLVEGLFCFDTKGEMMQVLSGLSDFRVMQLLTEIQSHLCRRIYNGMFDTKSKLDFRGRLKQFIAPKMEDKKWNRIKNKF